jgi:hypothetical protein
LARILGDPASDEPNGRSRVAELAALLLGLVASAAGEMAGYVFGRSGRPDFDDTSFHRLRYVRDADREADADERAPPTPSLP